MYSASSSACRTATSPTSQPTSSETTAPSLHSSHVLGVGGRLRCSAMVSRTRWSSAGVFGPVADHDLALAQRHVAGRRVGRLRVAGRDPVGNPGRQGRVDRFRDRGRLLLAERLEGLPPRRLGGLRGAELLVAAVGVDAGAVAVQVIARLVADDEPRRRTQPTPRPPPPTWRCRPRSRRRPSPPPPPACIARPAPRVIRAPDRPHRARARGSRRVPSRSWRRPAADRCGRSAGRAPTGSAP